MRRHALALIIFALTLWLTAAPGGRAAGAANQGDPQVPAAPAGAQLAALTGPQPWVMILCKFQDVADEPHPPAYFQNLLANTYPGLDHYWREVSYGTISLAGSAAVGWYTLPHPKSYYLYDRNGDGQADHDHNRTTADCTAAADPAVNFAAFYGIGMIFNDELNEPSTGGTLSSLLTLDGKRELWPMAWIPEPYISQGVIAHEMGHAFGLGHIFVKDSPEISGWDLMGAPCYYGSQRDPTYGCVGLHLNAATKEWLGWMPAAQIVTATLGTSPTITLEQLAQPQTDNARMVRIPINGSLTRYYVVEARRKAGYDDAPATPGPAVLIYETTIRTLSSGRQFAIVEQIAADLSAEPGGAGAGWSPGMTFVDAVNQITVSVVAETASGYTVSVTNSGSKYRVSLPLIRG